MSIEISEECRKIAERRINEGAFSSVSEYVESLIARDNELDEAEQVNARLVMNEIGFDKFDEMLDEAESDIEQGRFRVHMKGDIVKKGEEMIRQRLQAKRS